MANANAPHGFQFVSLNRPFPPTVRVYDKLSSVDTAIFQNDVVLQVAGVSGHNAAPIEPFVKGTPGTSIPLGVALNYGPASTATRHHVIVDQSAEYEAQDDNSTDGITAGNMGLNANVTTTAGNATTGFSKHQIAEASVNISASRDMHLLRLYPDINNAFGANARILVKFNQNREGLNTVGV